MRAARFTSATGGSWRSARPRLADRLACGVTTVADLFGHPPAMLARRAAAAASPGTRPRVLVAGQGITSPGGHPTSTAYAWSPTLAASAALQTDDPTQARAHIRRLAEADRADLIKITCSDLGGRPAGPRNTARHRRAGPQFRPPGAGACSHRCRRTPRAYLADAYPALPARLQPAGRALTLAAGEQARIRAAAARRILTATLDGGLAQASATGVRIAAGTDAGNNYTPHGWSLHRELNLLRQAGLDAGAVLAAATHVAAGKLGRLHTGVGRITHGGPADVLILTADPRRSTPALTQPDLIIAAGDILQPAGQPTTNDGTPQ